MVDIDTVDLMAAEEDKFEKLAAMLLVSLHFFGALLREGVFNL
jgi:hypothetical protein